MTVQRRPYVRSGCAIRRLLEISLQLERMALLRVSTLSLDGK